MNRNLNLAHRLYSTEGKTQKEIAGIVGVSERTIYTWIHQHGWERSPYTPAVIEASIYRQVAELQNAIDAREPGNRFPTMQEAEVIRKLICSAEKLRKATGAVQPKPTQPKNTTLASAGERKERPEKEPAIFRIPKHKPTLTDKQALARWRKHTIAIMKTSEKPGTKPEISQSQSCNSFNHANLGSDSYVLQQCAQINDLPASDQPADGNAQYAVQVQVLASEE